MQYIRNFQFKSIIAITIISFFVAFFLYSIWLFAPDFPIWDDYDAVLGFLIKYKQSNSFTDTLATIFSQHNEHRIVFNRLVTLFFYELMGHVNFKVLILFGYSGLILIAYFLCKLSELDKDDNVLFCIPVFFIVFNYLYYELIWAMASIQNIWVFVFALATLYALKKDKLTIAIICGAAATFTSGNGMFIFIASIWYFVIIHKNWRLVVWLLSALVLISFYFYGYKIPTHGLSESTKYVNGIKNISFDKMTDVAIYVTYFIGGSINIFDVDTAILGGGMLLLLLIALLFLYVPLKRPLLFSLILFVVLTILSNAWGRVDMGVDTAFAPRYRIVSCILLATIYCAYIKNILPHISNRSKNYLVGFCIVASGFYCAWTYDKMIYHIYKSRIEPFASLKGGSIPDKELLLNSTWLNADKNIAVKRLQMSDSLGIFKSTF